MLTLRYATLEDAQAILGLFDDFQHEFLSDYDWFDPNTVLTLIPNMGVVDAFNTYPVGVVWVNDQFQDIHISIHMLLRPEYIRPALREEIFQQVIDAVFDRYQVAKIKAYTLESQGMAIKLLFRHGFKNRAFFPNDTRQGGKLIAVRIFELSRHAWDVFRKHPERLKKHYQKERQKFNPRKVK